MPASNPPKKKSGVCPKCKQKFSFEIKPGMASVECPHCEAKIKLKPKAKKSLSSEDQSRSTPEPTPKTPAKTETIAANAPSPTATSQKPKPNEAKSASKLKARETPTPPSTPTPTPPPKADVAIVPPIDVPDLPTAAPTSPKFDSIETQPTDKDKPRDISLPVPSPVSNGSLPTLKFSTNDETASEDKPDEAIAALVPKVDLLPPKFIVDQTVANVVILPSADGGTQVIDPNVVHVQHDGQTISLKTLTPIQKARRKAIQNFVILLLAGLMLVAAIWILL